MFVSDLSLLRGIGFWLPIKHNFVKSFTSGNSTYCWILDKTALAVAVVTPVSLALVFNVTCLTKNIYAIYHLQQVCPNVLRRD